MDKNTSIKAEIFDIITAQEQVKEQFNQLEQYKQEKLKELQEELARLQTELAQAEQETTE